MNALFLIKPGELTLKGNNRAYFERVLRRNIRAKLRSVRHVLSDRHSRLYVTVDETDAGVVSEALRKTMGISGFCRAYTCGKAVDEMEELTAFVVRGQLDAGKGAAYKIDVHREDKNFPLDSYGIACELGKRLGRRFPELKVSLKAPDWILHVEVRESVYCYSYSEEGVRGLPVGVAGRGLLLLSGGIDSPVAGFLMAARGLRLDAIYFHSYPYTGRQAQEKVETLARLLSEWTGRLNLYVVPFTDIQVKIREKAPAAQTTLLSRACMMRIATYQAYRRKANSLVTGESLSQVASQTAESIRFTGHFSELPVFRPLVGMDKEWIVAKAREIGTFETSILPYEDCCVVFSPKHPVIRPDFAELRDSYDSLGIEEDLRTAVRTAEVLKFG